MVVEVKDLAKRVDNGGEPLTILHEISFAVAAGETVAIVGASGSGKSTLLGLLAGLDLPSSGTVALAGEDLGSLDEDARAVLRGRVLGFVFQTFQLLPSLNAIENVMLPLELAGAANARAEAEHWLQRVGLAHRCDTIRNISPAGNSSASPWRVPLPRVHSWCWPTSRPATSTPRPAIRSSS
jgi:putative ABC transport system ATP-binding protein